MALSPPAQVSGQVKMLSLTLPFASAATHAWQEAAAAEHDLSDDLFVKKMDTTEGTFTFTFLTLFF